MTTQFLRFALAACTGLLLATACSNGSQRSFTKEPVDNLVRDYTQSPELSIILYDMDYQEDQDQYRHQYRILYQPQGRDTLEEKMTDWMAVSPQYFESHVNDMGMALVTKTDGKVEKKVSPPGYNNYVGNEKYGKWEKQSDGTSFWAFYGQYAFMRSMLGYGYGPIYYGGWNDYRRNYYPRGRTYYGRGNGGGTRFGTSGTHTTQNNRSSRWNGRSSAFKQRVRSRVKQSASRSRSNSRFRSRSSSRSRGFGGGK